MGCEGFVSMWWVQQPPDELLGRELACLNEPDFTVTVALSALQLSYTHAVIFQELYCSMALFTPRIPSCHHHKGSKIDETRTQNHVARPYKMDGGRRFQLRSSRLYPADGKFWFPSNFKSHQRKVLKLLPHQSEVSLDRHFTLGVILVAIFKLHHKNSDCVGVNGVYFVLFPYKARCSKPVIMITGSLLAAYCKEI